ncbi:MAG: SUMF1/EgtB/PvdO family nonheme iron enzyme [Caldilineae bacterium]|nr:SUMF1/EgtB/PvdO family nonheme iron enzyme [Caldilineae bacterium]
MTQLPTGTVTFLFTDIEGSTQRWDEHPDAMRAALERHDALMRQAVEASAGQVFKTVGDAFCAAFATAGAGLAAAIEAQRAIAAEVWSRFGEGFPPILVRMGLHTGEATERGGDYFGQPVNRVARIEAAGNGGQLLLSRETRRLVESEGLPESCRMRDLGEHRLKDLRHSERISQVLIAGLPDDSRPLRTAGEIDARDRIQVLEAHAGTDSMSGLVLDRSVSETFDAIEVSLRRDSDGAILTTDQVVAAARHKPADWREYRLGRVAEWSQPRYRLDGRFVGLTLLIDQGEEAAQGRWQASEERYEDLGELLAATTDPAIVVLGPPGGGKSTLLRRLELDSAFAGMRAEDGLEDRVTFFISLNTYKAARAGEPLPFPAEWLAAQWQARNPGLPALEELLSEGRVTLLLDALNEMPSAGEKEFRERVQLWKEWLQLLAATSSGNRIVFSSRSLDYSQSLSTPDLRVPQVRIENLTDAQVRDFLEVYSPGRWREIWAALEGSPQLEVLRSPYFLALLVEQVEATGEMPAGRAALFTGFVRQALRRELERGSPIFDSDALLASRDRRQVSRWRWKGDYDLPERGLLVPGLARLAHAMQIEREYGERSQVRIDIDDALDLLDSHEDEAIVAAGEALPPLVEIPGGTYPIGDDEPIELAGLFESSMNKAHLPRHAVEIESFQIGRFPVMHAEWACFIAAGGYADERWWDTHDAKRWWRGELANEAGKSNNRYWRKRHPEDVNLFEQMVEEERLGNEEAVERCRSWMTLDEEAFEAALEAHWAGTRQTEPRFWRDGRLNRPAQPVVGVCWYEARAYCAWLGAQTAVDVRLPREVEWESAARGMQARAYPHGEVFDRLASNSPATHLGRSTPVGVFRNERTPEGVDDLSGNVREWTSSLFGEVEFGEDEPAYPYPYDVADGREDADAAPSANRVLKGGAWGYYWTDAQAIARAAMRSPGMPGNRGDLSGLRVAVSSSSNPNH